MNTITINPELKSVTEKHMDMDWLTIAGLTLASLSALAINMFLPIDDVLKGIISMIVAAPIVLVSIKDFYGLKSYRLAVAAIECFLNDRDLVYESQGVWKEMNKYARGRRKESDETKKNRKKHTADNAGNEASR